MRCKSISRIFSGGIVDFASGTFDSVKRVTETSQEIGKKRPTIELKENLYAIVLIQPTYTRLACSEEVLKDSDSSFHYLS